LTELNHIALNPNGSLMSVTILITPVLRPFTENRKSVIVEGNSVRDCLKNLVARYPQIEKWIFANPEAPLICMFLNKKVVLPDALDSKVNEGDTIDVSPVIAGG
jgi:molybdopterin converting factor small subunit